MRDLSRGRIKKLRGNFWLPRGFFAHAIAKADRICYNKHKQIDDRSFHRKVVIRMTTMEVLALLTLLSSVILGVIRICFDYFNKK